MDINTVPTMREPAKANQRFLQLDSLRGLAALAVFTTHAISGVISVPLLVKIDHTPLSIFINGNAAVMFFFVLSGFVLSLVFIDGQRPISLTSFYTKRIFRIYPAFIATVIFAVLLKQFVFHQHVQTDAGIWFKQYWLWDLDAGHLKQVLQTLLLISPNINYKLLDPPMWSLAVEMSMAFVIPFFILMVARCNIIVNICLFVLLCYLSYGFKTYLNFHAGIFYLGVILAKHRHIILNFVGQLSVTAKILLLLSGLLIYNSGMWLLNLRETPYYVIFVYCLPAIGSAIIIVSVLSAKRLSAFFELRFFAFFGAITYSFYLMHFPVLFTLSSVLIGHVNLYLVVVIGLGINIGISYLMMRFIEQPFQAIASRLVKKYRFLNSANVKIK
jgi:peptidoglycan/LPS O-acetylase OafA/YrhL